MRPSREKLSPAKREQILRGAEAVFLEMGFEGSSMNDIARRAGVSKGTLYNHFEDKNALFEAFVQEMCHGFSTHVLELDPNNEDLESVLAAVGRQFMDFLLKRESLNLVRIVAAESVRLPEMGRTLNQAVPLNHVKQLAEYLRDLNTRGRLKVDNPEQAATSFLAMCHGDVYLRGLLSQPVSEDEIKRSIEGAVCVFIGGCVNQPES